MIFDGPRAAIQNPQKNKNNPNFFLTIFFTPKNFFLGFFLGDFFFGDFFFAKKKFFGPK